MTIGCANKVLSTKMEFIDQMNRPIQLESTPKRIISLVPSQTELLFDLGLEKEVVGITKFCIHPKNWFQKKIYAILKD